MPDQQYQRERELFDACAAAPAEVRDRLLAEREPDDPELVERVRRLLSAYDAAGATTHPAVPLTLPEAPGEIGPYRVLNLLGEGGMGAVYLAEQTEPIRRRVAIKVIKAGMDTRQVVARFHAERQALAVMDHPNIAKVFDAGSTPDGRPYFAMELVEGTPLLQWCQENALPVRTRVRLFLSVCQAVQHAHQKGVVHRDLKPGNILIAAQEAEEAIPKVIDFGIAKALEGDLTDLTLETMAAHVIGTPAYMSPEQAAAGSMDIDTRSDVYSLGVVLFQLLTGTLPHDPARSAHIEFLMRLGRRELEPPAASSREPSIPADLDWVLQKAMAPDRERRYETVLAFAEDLQRFLDDEPVTARPPTAVYRLRKFARRHRAEVAAASFALFALLAGLVALFVGLYRATEAEQRARQEAQAAVEVSNFLVALFESSEPGESGGADVTARALLDRGVTRIQYELQNQPLVQARLLETLSRVEQSLGEYAQARDLALRAVQLQPNNPMAHLALARGRARLGQFEEARRSIEKALELHRRQSGERSLPYARALDELSGLQWQLGQFEEALRLATSALAIKEELEGAQSFEAALSLRASAVAQADLRRPKEAIALFERALMILESAKGPNHPLVADNLDSLALAQATLRQTAAARANHERALTIRKTVLGVGHPVIAYSYLNLARLAAQEGKLKDAAPLYEESLRIREASLGPTHPRTADIVESQAILYARLGDLPRARKGFERSLAIYTKSLGPRHVETLESHRNLAILCVMQGDHRAALDNLRAALENGYAREMHLEEKTFDPLRQLPAFQELERDLRAAIK